MGLSMHRSWIGHGALPRTGKKRVICALLKTPKTRGHSYKVPSGDLFGLG
jgi:hypothetical protein